MKKKMLILLILIIVPILAILIVSAILYPDNIAETAPDGGTKNLKTRYYKTTLENAEKIIGETIPTISTYGSNWKITAVENPSDDKKIIKAEVPVIVFTDDLSVTIKKGAEDGITQVDVRSASRVGKSDFGENRRHIEQLLEILDKKF